MFSATPFAGWALSGRGGCFKLKNGSVGTRNQKCQRLIKFREEIEWLKVVFTVLIAIDVSSVGWHKISKVPIVLCWF